MLNILFIVRLSGIPDDRPEANIRKPNVAAAPRVRPQRGSPRSVRGRRRPTAELVGRRAELALLVAALSDARQAERPRLAVIAAELGIGKTRLTEAFLDGVGLALSSIVGHCVAYGEDSTYQPLVELLRAAAGITVEDGASDIRDKVRRLADDDCRRTPGSGQHDRRR